MGLDVSHGAWSGAYSRFNRFRVAVGRSCGVRFPEGSGDDMIYFPPGFRDSYPGLTEFFCHSDCDGTIDPQTCAVLGREMLELTHVITPEWRVECDRFALGCLHAAKAGEPLEFG